MTDQSPLLQVSEADLDDLRHRLRTTRWPATWPVEPWAAGTDPTELARLVGYWAEGYDWLRWQDAINELPSRFAVIGGRRVHYLKFDGANADAVPVILTNGWPSTFFEMVGLAQRLAWQSERRPTSTGRGCPPRSRTTWREWLPGPATKAGTCTSSRPVP